MAPIQLVIHEDKDNTYVRAELPGVDRKDISVEIADGNLEIVVCSSSRRLERNKPVVEVAPATDTTGQCD